MSYVVKKSHDGHKKGTKDTKFSTKILRVLCVTSVPFVVHFFSRSGRNDFSETAKEINNLYVNYCAYVVK